MKNEIMYCTLESTDLQQPTRNPLIRAMGRILGRLTTFKDLAREFYFDVILTAHPCLACGGSMRMTGQSECSCSCGIVLDPTVEFQRSPCCDAMLVKKVFHYSCSCCGKVISSLFLFDERVFNREYFREMMRVSRKRKLQKREEIKRLLVSSRSDALSFTELPDLDDIPGLKNTLDEFVGAIDGISAADFTGSDLFHMQEYKAAILARLKEYEVLFSSIPPVCDDRRKDKVRRFITLIYMEHDSEVELTQYGDDILVERYEAHNEG